MSKFHYQKAKNILNCQKPNHENQEIIFICTDKLCDNNRLVCSNCLLTQHNSHVNSLVNITDIIQKKTNDATLCQNYPTDPLAFALKSFLFSEQKSEENLVPKIINCMLDDLLNNITAYITILKKTIENESWENMNKIELSKLERIYDDYYNLNEIENILNN